MNIFIAAMGIIAIIIGIVFVSALFPLKEKKSKYIMVTVYEDHKAVLQQSINLKEPDGSSYDNGLTKYSLKWEQPK